MLNPKTNTLDRLVRLAAVASAISLASSLIRAKVIAVVLGPAGVGQQAELIQLASLLSVPLAMVAGPALLSALARAGATSIAGAGSRQHFYDAAATLTVGWSVIAVGLAGALASAGINGLPPRHAGLLGVLATAGLVSTSLVGLPWAVLNVSGGSKRFSWIQAVLALATASMTILGTLSAGLTGALAASVVAPWLALGLAYRAVKAELPGVRLWPHWAWDPDFLKASAAVGLSSLLGGLAQQGALTAVRAQLAQFGGNEANGQFQAAYAIATTYLGVVLSGLGNVFAPRFAAAGTTEALQQELNGALHFLTRYTPPLVLIGLGLRHAGVTILYSAQFSEAAELLGPAMAADVIKVVAWVSSYALLVRGRARAFLVTESLGAGTLALLSVFCLHQRGVVGMGNALALSSLAYVFITTLTAKVVLGITPPWGPIFKSIGLATVLFGSLWLPLSERVLSGFQVLLGVVWLVAVLEIGWVRKQLGRLTRLNGP